MAEMQETKVGRSWEDELRNIIDGMTDDDWRRFCDNLRQMEEQKKMCIRDRGKYLL